MSILEFFKSISDASKERIINPVLGTFALSFVAFNWQAFMAILLSTKEIEEVFKDIQDYSSTNTTLWVPIAFTIFFNLAIPYIMMAFDNLTSFAIDKRNDFLHHRRIKELNQEVSRAEKKVELEDARANYTEKAELNNEIQKLNSDLNDKESALKKIQKEVEAIQETYNSISDANEDFKMSNEELQKQLSTTEKKYSSLTSENNIKVKDLNEKKKQNTILANEIKTLKQGQQKNTSDTSNLLKRNKELEIINEGQSADSIENEKVIEDLLKHIEILQKEAKDLKSAAVTKDETIPRGTLDIWISEYDSLTKLHEFKYFHQITSDIDRGITPKIPVGVSNFYLSQGIIKLVSIRSSTKKKYLLTEKGKMFAGLESLK